MDEVVLRWSRAWPFADLSRNPNLWFTRGLYAFLTPTPLEVLYIGMTYDQRFSTEIARHLGPLDRGIPVVSRADAVGRWIYKKFTVNPYAKIAHIELANGERISRQLVEDVEAALINIHTPPANLRSMRAYYGRAIRIRHKGYKKPFEAEHVMR